MYDWYLVPSQGLRRHLKANEERILLLTKDKTKLENDFMDMTKSTGDSSTLITKLNEDIKQKERSALICLILKCLKTKPHKVNRSIYLGLHILA